MENMNNEVNLEELKNVTGGSQMTMEGDDPELQGAMLTTNAVSIVMNVIKTLASGHLPETFEEFYRFVDEHATAIYAAWGVTSPGTMLLYAAVEKESFWRKVYDMMK